MEITTTDLAEIAELAAEEVNKGWCQGKLSDGEGNVCAIGAVEVATYKFLNDIEITTDRMEVIEKIMQPLHFATTRQLPTVAWTIAQWNDARGRTKEEVVDMWMSVAKEFRNA